jgi:hypothetical protein
MDKDLVLYLCPLCFQVCEEVSDCHEHQTLACRPGQPGDRRRKPLENQFGEYVSRAPRWYLEARGSIPAYTPLAR